MKTFIYFSKLSTVNGLLGQLPAPRFNENQNTDSYGMFLMQELFRAEVPSEEIIETALLLRDSGKNARALHIATEIAMRRHPPNALPFLDTLAKEQDPLRPHYFWPLIMYNYRRHGESGILRTLKLMYSMNVICDKETMTQYCLPRLLVTLEKPLEALEHFERVGIKSSLVMTPLLAQLMNQQRMSELLELTQTYPTKVDNSLLIVPLAALGINAKATKRLQQFVKVLSALAAKAEQPKFDFIGLLLQDMMQHNQRFRDDTKALQHFVTELKKAGLSIAPSSGDAVKSLLPSTASAELYKLIQDLCNSSLQATESFQTTNNSALASKANYNSSIVKHPRDMNLEELEYHLIELEGKSLNTRGVLRRLLQLCVRDNQLQRALEIKGKCDSLKVQESAGMLASTFELYIKLKDLKKAQACLQQLQTKFSSKFAKFLKRIR